MTRNDDRQRARRQAAAGNGVQEQRLLAIARRRGEPERTRRAKALAHGAADVAGLRGHLRVELEIARDLDVARAGLD